MITYKNKEEAPDCIDMTDLPVTRAIIVLVFAIFFGMLLYVLINEFFTHQ